MGVTEHECERCGTVAECEAVETHPAIRYEPADGIYLCRPCLDHLDDAREAAEERRAEERAERDYDW